MVTTVRDWQEPPSCPRAQESSQAAVAEVSDKISTAAAVNAAAISLTFTESFYRDLWSIAHRRDSEKELVGKAVARMVGASRFELETSCAQGRRATRLRYAPTQGL